MVERGVTCREKRRAPLWLLLGTLATLSAPGAVLAQNQSSAPTAQAGQVQAAPSKPRKAAAAAKRTPSESVVINLIELLVEQHVLTRDKADALIRQAREEAAAAKRGTTAAVVAPVPVAGAAPSAPGAPTLAEGTAGMGGPPAAAAAAPTSSVVRVPYVPEIVKQEIEENVKNQVLQTAKNENWAQPDAIPEWIRRLKWDGDIRVRFEDDRFDPGNAPFENFAAVNSGNPVDFTGLSSGNSSGVPFLDTTQDRERLLLRARLGLQANISDGFSAGFRLASGSTNTPVSTNQTLGNDFDKLNIYIDRAYLQYAPNPSISLWAGRMPNPWFYTNLVWSQDLNFDGVAGTYRYTDMPNVTPFFTAGAFPVENTTFNLPATTETQFPSRDKWLFGAQAGAEWKINETYRAKLGLAYYDFKDIEGEATAVCTITAATDPCPTDASRPLFMQKGNSLFPLRTTIINTTTSTASPEYFGLASKFRELDLTGQLDIAAHDPYHLIIDGDFVTNLGFDRQALLAMPIVSNGGVVGGNTAFFGQLTFGFPEIQDRWDWNVSAGYKYIESDAVVDAFNDSDFHLGGTNAKGFILGGNLGLSHGVWLGGHWFSASEIVGPPLKIDVVQVEINGKF